MGLNAAVVRVVVTDANIPINLIQVQCLEILGRSSGYELVVPDEVIREVTYPIGARHCSRCSVRVRCGRWQLTI
jgi:hypothetical protein